MSAARKKYFDILLVEDNPADVRLTMEALGDLESEKRLFVAKDGEEAMDFVKGEGEFVGSARPDLILLDLNLPKKNGLEVLEELKSDPDYKRIPVVVLTTSGSDRDVIETFNLHANSYIQKPVEYDNFLEAMENLRVYWFRTSRLPPK
ncbi:response regulator [Leptospira wolffii]|uniref:Response regulator n=1 Tax=Leptospira wolffii TaxID=409998 RepID=A0A2M9Z8H4_9LEPT|nr:response regulator [Leptospira wolffii]PJZ64728.1 two-component system response regulator [Leptospira wolffii]TGK56978.1 response regulator [Leptospira wolffii]TGK71011.1 response regulator [Leptospira wolffii]TGK75702.1 response regulator [Leptospira wolffii]TGL32750.1 response regulator [Leptospira wolffii]